MHIQKLFIICCFYTALFAGDIKILHQRVDIQANGSAFLTVICAPDSLKTGTIILPCQFAVIESLVCKAPEQCAVRIIDSLHVKYLQCTTTNALFNDSIIITGIIPRFVKLENAAAEFGHIAIKQRFSNTSPRTIKKYLLDIILPAGYAISSIDESIPKVNANNPEIPYTLSEFKNRHMIQLTGKDLKIGDLSSIAVTVKEESKSNIFLLVLIAAILAYIVFYRDILKAKPEKEQ